MINNVFDLAITDLLGSAGLDPSSVRTGEGQLTRQQLEAVLRVYFDRRDYFNAVFNTNVVSSSVRNLTRVWNGSVGKHWRVVIDKKPRLDADGMRVVHYFMRKAV